jgi:hypothetical protein
MVEKWMLDLLAEHDREIADLRADLAVWLDPNLYSEAKTDMIKDINAHIAELERISSAIRLRMRGNT